MRVLIAPDNFGSTLGAAQVAAAMADGWVAGAPHDRVTALPLSSAGPGWLDVIAASVAGESIAATVSDPLGRPVPAEILISTQSGRRTAYLDAAQAVGLHLLAADERNPGLTSSWGVGELLAAAVEEGAERIVVGIGGDAVNDGGAGALSALGAGPAEVLARGGLALTEAPTDALAGLPGVRARLRDIELLVATAHPTPLLGLQGTSATESPDKGARPDTAQALEAALGHFVDLARRHHEERIDLVTGQPRRLDREPGAGCGGGLAYGLMLLGGRRVDGTAQVVSLTDLKGQLGVSDLVVTGVGLLDWTQLRESVVAAVADAAMTAAVPAVAISGETLVGRRELMAMGLAASYAVAERPEQVEQLVADPVGTLRERAARIARTWSPGPR